MSVVERGIYEIRVYRELCKACGLCVAWCPQKVLVPDAEAYPVAERLADCVNCKACERHCPDFAIEVIPPKPESAPQLETADVDRLLHAR